MNKKNSLKLLITCYAVLIVALFFFSPYLTSANEIKLNVGIPTPSGIVNSVQDSSSYINAFFQFMVIVLAMTLTATLIFSGGLYVMSAGLPTRIEFAKNLIKRTTFALLTLLFSIVIINQINPSLTNLNAISTPGVKKIVSCDFLNPIECEQEPLCEWKKEEESCERVITLTCDTARNKDECESVSQCQWGNNACTQIKPKETPPCNLAKTSQECFVQQGCTWDSGCDLKENKRSLSSQTILSNPCLNLKTPELCSQSSDCSWFSTGRCAEQFLASHKICNQITDLVACEYSAYCVLEAKALGSTERICTYAQPSASKCSEFDKACSLNQFCSKDNICQPKKLIGEPCADLSYKKSSYAKETSCQLGLYCDIKKNLCVPCNEASTSEPTCLNL